MSFRREMKEDFGAMVFMSAVVSAFVPVVLAYVAVIGFFVRGCVPTITAAGDKFAKRAVESMGEDFEEHSWKIDKKDEDSERTSKDDKNETPKDVKQGSEAI